MKKLSNKVALVTGSAKGLGKALAERYASLGANVIVNYAQDKDSADETVKAITATGVQVIAIQADMTKVTDIERLFSEAKQAFGKLDIVVANAGMELVDVPVTDYTEAQFDQLFTLNTKGNYFTMQQAAKHVGDHGRIIYISSSTTSFPVPGMAVYGGSKTGPRYLVEVLSKEIAHRGVTVNSIIPYATEGAGIFTHGHSSQQMLIDANPMKRLATVDDVANIAEFFASELSSFVNGQHLLVNGGATL